MSNPNDDSRSVDDGWSQDTPAPRASASDERPVRAAQNAPVPAGGSAQGGSDQTVAASTASGASDVDGRRKRRRRRRRGERGPRGEEGGGDPALDGEPEDDEGSGNAALGAAASPGAVRLGAAPPANTEQADGQAAADTNTANPTPGAPRERRERHRRERRGRDGQGARDGQLQRDGQTAREGQGPRSGQPQRDPRGPASRDNAQPQRHARDAQPTRDRAASNPATADATRTREGRSEGRNRTGQGGRGAEGNPGQRDGQRRQRHDRDARRGPATQDHAPGAVPRPAHTTPAPDRAPAAVPEHLLLAAAEPSVHRPRVRAAEHHHDDAAEHEAGPVDNTRWGNDDDLPTSAVAFVADLPVDNHHEEPSPSAVVQHRVDFAAPVWNIAGVRFSPTGRVSWVNTSEVDCRVGDTVIVEGERSTRAGVVVVAPTRKTSRDRSLRRALRLATPADAAAADKDRAAAAELLRIAKDRAAALRLPVKVFRVEWHNAADRHSKVLVYYTTEERVDVREFLRQLSNATPARIELRQLGVRDEAKAVGGIGSCGLSLCCSTWLPDFVPVSIKMAKDQGLVLNPSKVSGQCGRLKCCLVYEQAGYAELRKGLPKLGKRVISARGEGRVVEVDVLRQRIRVSYGPGDAEVLPATEVRPMFPSANDGRGDAARSTERGSARGGHASADRQTDEDDDEGDAADVAGLPQD